MYWQLAKLCFFAFAPFIPVDPVVKREIRDSKYRLIIECEGFETLFEFTRELVREHNDICYDMWSKLRMFYSETIAAKQLDGKEA